MPNPKAVQSFFNATNTASHIPRQKVQIRGSGAAYARANYRARMQRTVREFHAHKWSHRCKVIALPGLFWVFSSMFVLGAVFIGHALLAFVGGGLVLAGFIVFFQGLAEYRNKAMQVENFAVELDEDRANN